MLFRGCVFAFLLFAAAGTSAWAVTIPFVTVGDAGNAADPLNSGTTPGIGAVAVEYRIAETEVTIGQYAEFLNAIAATDDVGLYNANMGTDGDVAGVSRSGTNGSYTYAVIGTDDRPIAHASWLSAARFVNWLHNGQPSGVQDATSTEDGAYDLSPPDPKDVVRKVGAVFFIPTLNEWYKAAYHQPAGDGGDADDYWLFATGSNASPDSDNPANLDAPDHSQVGNFYLNDGINNGYNGGFAVSGALTDGGDVLTPVGGYTLASSYYETFDQGGSLYEMLETPKELLFPPGTAARAAVGGAWGSTAQMMASTNPLSVISHGFGNNATGFRVASLVPSAIPFVQGTVDLIDNPAKDVEVEFVTQAVFEYELQTGMNLVDWVVLETTTGNGQLFAHTHAGGWSGARRYYRVMRTELGP